MPRFRHIVVICLLIFISGSVYVYLMPNMRQEVDAPVVDDHLREVIQRVVSAEAPAVSDLEDISLKLIAGSSNIGFLDADQLTLLGEHLVEEGWFVPAEKCFVQALQMDELHRRSHLQLAQLNYVSGRYDVALQHWELLLITGGMDLINMPFLGNRTLRLSYMDAAIDKGVSRSPPDPLCLNGAAQLALQQNELAKCRSLAEQAYELRPSLTEAYVLIGKSLYEAGQLDQLNSWLAASPAQAMSLAEWYMLYGHVSRQKGEFTTALGCYAEAFQKDPTLYQAVDQLVHLRHNQTQVSEQLIDYLNALREYAKVCRNIHDSSTVTEKQLHDASQFAAQMRSLRESLAWCEFARVLYPEALWPVGVQQQLREYVKPNSRRFNPQDDPRNMVDFSNLPLFDLSSPNTSETPLEYTPQAAASQPSVSPVQIQFEEYAKVSGIDFTFIDGADAQTETTKLFEFTGGGVAVLDYDLNGQPDLFFTQGGPPPDFPNGILSTDDDAEIPSDQLCSQVTTNRFVSTTQPAGLTEAQYGQGVCVGDYNSDGLPDLYVANIGPNVLYENMGDGTFLKDVQKAFRDAPGWTTSCLLADLNGDGFPDIYDVQYVVPEGIHTEMCASGDASIPCELPHKLHAAVDRVFINQNDGTFLDVTQSSGAAISNGLGLGVIAADFDGSGQLSLFIANDARPNFLLVNQTQADQNLKFSEEAMLRGVALSEAGREQACMGVAVDDVDGDGLLDLFSTNFYADYNILYRQRPGFFFEDRTQIAGLKQTSYDSLGFGTQFIDADLDGDMDIVLTNGDVVDFSSINPNRTYQQQPQFIENRGPDTFEAVSASQLGNYFEQKQLGRSLAKLDVNLDGKSDFVVSHINSPAELLLNTTQTSGHFLQVKLIGTITNRDAIGTRVKITTDRGTIVKQLTSGDGYQASNERLLTFGLGADTVVNNLEVQWLSGKQDVYQNIPADKRILLIESSETPLFLPQQ